MSSGTATHPSDRTTYLKRSLTVDPSFTWRTAPYVRVLGVHDGTNNGVLIIVSLPLVYTY